MIRTNQGGSILSFVVVGGVLTLLLLGGAYFVHQHTQAEPAPSSTPAPVAQQPSTDNKSDAKDSHDAKKDQPASQDTSTSADRPSATKPDTAPTPVTPSPDSTPATIPSGSVDSSTTQALPHTGPAETIMSVVAVGLLTVAALSYGQSRRLRTSL